MKNNGQGIAAQSARPRARGAATLAKLRRAKIPIAYKLSFVFSTLITLAMGTLGFVVITSQSAVLRDQIQGHGNTVARQMAQSAKDLILADDPLGISVLTANLSSDQNILGTAVVDAKGKILAHAGIIPFAPHAQPHDTHASLFGTETQSLVWNPRRAGNETSSVVSFVTPIRVRDVTAGHVLVTFSRAILDQSIDDSVRAILTATVALILIAIALSFVTSKRLSRPIHHLMDASKKIGEGQLDFRIKERRNDELGDLMNSFNSMADGLLRKGQVESAFSRYVDDAIARKILADLENVKLGGRHVNAAVLFADIVGFTKISEFMTPKATVDLLNEYFSYIDAASKLYRGAIDKFMGDCAMLVFGVAEPDPERRFHSVACAVLVQRIVERLNERRAAANQFPVWFRLGINSGDMLAGNMGSNKRMEYTVVGDTVNLASRLCSYSEPGRIIISKELYEHDDVRSRVRARRHAPILLRERNEPVATYLVEGLAAPYQQTVDDQVDAILAGRAVA